MSITVKTIEIDNTYEITAVFVDKNSIPVAASETKFRVYNSDYSSEFITAIDMVAGGTTGTYVAYIDTSLLPAGKYIFRVEGLVNGRKVGDNEFVKIMLVEPE